MRTLLLIPFEFVASHSLSGFEEPHPHLWSFELRLTGTPIEGRIVDLAELGLALENYLKVFKDCYLNESPYLSEAAKKFPTCETLSESFCTALNEKVLKNFRLQNPSIKICSLQVSLCDVITQKMMGAAVVEP